VARTWPRSQMHEAVPEPHWYVHSDQSFPHCESCGCGFEAVPCALAVLPLRRCIAHSVPSSQTIKTLAKLGPMVEVGAGSGYWSAMLMERKVRHLF
jgi:hypothetical protein